MDVGVDMASYDGHGLPWLRLALGFNVFLSSNSDY